MPSATVVKRFVPPSFLSTPSLRNRSCTDERGSTAWNWMPLAVSSFAILARVGALSMSTRAAASSRMPPSPGCAGLRRLGWAGLEGNRCAPRGQGSCAASSPSASEAGRGSFARIRHGRVGSLCHDCAARNGGPGSERRQTGSTAASRANCLTRVAGTLAFDWSVRYRGPNFRHHDIFLHTYVSDGGVPFIL
jgi:hypothetical protein